MPLNPQYFKPRGTWKAKLLTSEFDPSQSFEYLSELSAFAVSGTNVGDKALSISSQITGPRVVWDIEDIVWEDIDCDDFGFVIYYLDTGNTATSPVAHYDDVRDFTDPNNPVGRDFQGDYTHQTPAETLVFIAW